MTDRAAVQWFPGHMQKTLRSIREEMKNVDLVLELIDARIPKSSMNPEIAKLIREKPRVLLLNKKDLADEAATRAWVSYYGTMGYIALASDSRERGARQQVLSAVRTALGDQAASGSRRGMRGIKSRAMVVGIPNIGKSTFINTLAGGAAARTADRPGVTRGKQWIGAGDIDLLDMPGVLWPKFQDQRTAVNLAFTGAIADHVLDTAELAADLLREIRLPYQKRLEERYHVDCDVSADDYALLLSIAKSRGMLLPGGEIDVGRAAVMLLDELRGGKLGRISFEQVGDRGV